MSEPLVVTTRCTAAECPLTGGAADAVSALPRCVLLTLACMGLFLSSLSAGGSSFFFVSFFVRSGTRFFAPTHKSQTLSRAGAVKVGRRSRRATDSGVARPRLDSFEHGGTLGRSG